MGIDQPDRYCLGSGQPRPFWPRLPLIVAYPCKAVKLTRQRILLSGIKNIGVFCMFLVKFYLYQQGPGKDQIAGVADHRIGRAQPIGYRFIASQEQFFYFDKAERFVG